MTTTLTRIQLVVFALVTALAVGYGAINYFHVGTVVSPPFEVRAQFANAGGIYARADVDLLGTRVGSVRKIVPGPGTGTTVVLALDHGVKIPRDVTATIGSKSAIGEQYVELEPRSAGGPVLAGGDLIALADTSSPIAVSSLIGDLDALAGSIPTGDLRTVMAELSTALDGVGGSLDRLILDTDRLTRASLAGSDDLNRLIDDASTVLDTQVDKGPQTGQYLSALAGLSSELRKTDPAFGDLFTNGIRAGVQVSGLLAENQAALPVLLNQLVALTDVAADRIPAIRKTLVVFPYALEVGATGVRRCGSFNAKTGKPIEATCRYDEQGRPIYSAYLSLQLPLPPNAPYYPCTKGYEGTVKYYPNGDPVKGGARQKLDSPVNPDARCTARPDDKRTPLVRGAQNVSGPATAAGRPATAYGLAVLESRTANPPSGTAGLAWLLNSPMQ